MNMIIINFFKNLKIEGKDLDSDNVVIILIQFKE